MTLLVAGDTKRSPGADDLGAVAHLVEQLWAPVLAGGDLRIRVGGVGRGADVGWRDLERYQALPSIHGATMLLPAANRRVLAGSLLNFRGLRAAAPRLQRRLLGSAAATGLRLPFPTVRIQTRVADGRRPLLPTEQVAAELGITRVHASLGIRTAVNRKTTLQLVDDDGAPVGFAKFAWDPVSTTAVVREAAALEALAGGAGLVRAPRLLARPQWHEHPYLVSEPLPAGSRRPDPDVLPSAQEFFALCPIERHGPVGSSGQFAALRQRLEDLHRAGVEPEIATATADLLATIAHVDVPIAARWHADLTAWNCARDDEGRLWCWDWESSEPDAVAGLDAVHWAATSRTLRGRRYDGALLATASAQAAPILTAAGHSRTGGAVVAVLYTAALVERALGLIVNGGWDQGWLRRDEAIALLAFAHDRTRGLIQDNAGDHLVGHGMGHGGAH